MIERYTNPEMGNIWTLQHEFEVMLDVEIAACEAMAELGEIPKEAARNIREKAHFELDRVKEIEKETNHDIIAFLTNVAEYVGDDSKYIHKGLTSSDVKDTALGIMMKKSAELIIDDLKKFREVLKRRAAEFKHTVCIGRTHGIHAEPMTFGLKLALWMNEIDRDIERVEHAKKIVSVGKLSGAVGTYSNINPKIEELVCQKLGITPAPLATQVIQRDRHAEYMTTLAIVASSFEKFATEIRNLQRTDIREAEEYFSPGQKGSSAMPHKRNPITCERIAGMARLVRGNALASMENIALWHERDISHSSVERVILPDSTINVDYCIKKFTNIIDKLLVYPDAMMENLNKTGGLIFSQRILIALVSKGVLREDAYKWVQRNAMKRWLEKEDFKTNISKDEDVVKYLSQDEIDECFKVDYFLRHVDMIMARFGL
ncbi:adenylosuccinate lyase [Anaerovibrio lipolyticus]|uniref:Adenylosuccinate lyase n=3 Tax=Anaerovibrio TaxID=82373 RepID=A0A0B2K134_9FIRM|nr:adenylosuccinate lyase [Anaerovibrio lipolyticus]KHM52531.1 adenylosuccinate lyase [Anaerovibrio lipolyticus]SHI29674.1 adenylosuccinate lyase [Anaerovibrio lipolyticus DSM 3074]